MIWNYLNIAIRHIAKRKLFSIINIFGLAVGMAFTWLITSFVVGEMLVNNTLRQADNQYILRSKWKQQSMGFEDATAAPLGKLLKDEYPTLVANYYRFDVVTTAISVGNTHFVREVAEAGDPNMLSMYGFPMLHGDAQTALKEPNSIVITEENALKYFGRTDVLGRVLSLSNYAGSKQDFTVTGVLKSLPRNSVTYLWDLPVHIFIPLNGLQGRTDTDGWATRNMPTYLELQEGVEPSDLAGPIQRILATHAPNDINGNLQAYLTPLPDYYRAFNGGIVQKTIYTLSGIALFILFMAIVNFVNIAVVNASSRIREMGVRKALGGQKRQLIHQLFIESLVLTALATIISLLFYEVFRSPFADVVGRKLDSLWDTSAYFPVIIALFSAFIGMVAGAYPALKLSSLPAVDSLKGRLKSAKAGMLIRRLLVTAQFSVALLVFCGAVVITQQVAYFFTKDMGYNKDSILLVSIPRDWTPQGVVKMERVRDELARLPGIGAVSITSSTLKGGTGYDINLYPVGKDSTQSVAASVLQTDEHFLQTYQIPIVAGQFYNSSLQADQQDKLVLNEVAIRALGYKTPEAAVGKQLYTYGYNKPITIIGVTEDFSFRSLREQTTPMAISHVKGAGNLFSYLSIKMESRTIDRSLASIEHQFHKLIPDAPFEFYFADEALQQLYQAEIQLKKASQLATLLALFIVLIGIVGLVSLNITRRTKEVAIRKVLGASLGSIITLFMSEFFSAFVVAGLFTFPTAYFLMRSWLQRFAYHIDVSLLSFASIGLLFLIIVGLVVSLQTTKATLTNPIKSLRSD